MDIYPWHVWDSMWSALINCLYKHIKAAGKYIYNGWINIISSIYPSNLRNAKIKYKTMIEIVMIIVIIIDEEGANKQIDSRNMNHNNTKRLEYIIKFLIGQTLHSDLI